MLFGPAKQKYPSDADVVTPSRMLSALMGMPVASGSDLPLGKRK
jgi:hypothetical protein